MSGTTQAFSPVKIDALQRVASWILTDGVNSVSNTRCRTALSPTTSSVDRSGRPLAALEAKCDPAIEEVIVKNITLSADENLIAAARRRAVAEHTSLNEQFRLWLRKYVRREQQAAEAMRAIRELQRGIFTGGRKFTRDEMNER